MNADNLRLFFALVLVLVLVIEIGVLRHEEKQIEYEDDDGIIADYVLSAPNRGGEKWKHPTPSF
jgi:hypothetical protein